jgi:hypothetical protein
MIVFGLRRTRKQLAVVLAVCQLCSRPGSHTVIRTRRWFHLFFLPIIPLGTQYVSVCSVCNGIQSIDKDAAEDLQRQGVRQIKQPTLNQQTALLSVLGTRPTFQAQPAADWSGDKAPPMPPIQPPRAL